LLNNDSSHFSLFAEANSETQPQRVFPDFDGSKMIKEQNADTAVLSGFSHAKITNEG